MPRKDKQSDKPENPAFQTITIEVEKEDQRMDPKQFMLWGFLGTVTLLFTGLLTAYLVLSLGSDWGELGIPATFYITSLVILASSYTIHQGYKAAKADDIPGLQFGLLMSLLFGLLFLLGQGVGWYQMLSQGLTFQTNNGIAFLYLLSGLHALHIIGGVVFIAVTWWRSRIFLIHSRNMNGMFNCCTYWHFVDALWFYVFLFILIFQ